MYYQAVVKSYAPHAELVGLCDLNPGRLQMARDWVVRQGHAPVPGYAAAEFDRMIRETRPDAVIVTSVDRTHDEYICRAMELGCDAITEKPMTTTAEKCRRILATQKKTGRSCRVTFNYRYSPPRTQIKDLLMTGAIGDVLAVDFQWLLNTSHGADYFRRWHRNKVNSGGLMVHKATHHFDLVNWWLSSVPETVHAQGRRAFYRPETAARYGLKRRGERCRGCAEAKRCPFFLDLARTGDLRELYLDQERHDGYIRDQCVFSDRIDIEDDMQVIARYASGAMLSYSLRAYMPWEGHIVTFSGTAGRLEHKCMETVYVSGDGRTPGELIAAGTSTVIYPAFDAPYTVDIWTGAGGHGGGDTRLLDDVFLPHPPKDQYRHAADQRSGAYSILTGIAANESMRTGRTIRIRDLVPEIGMPDYTPMPSSTAPIHPRKKHPAAPMSGCRFLTRMTASALQPKRTDIRKVPLPPRDLKFRSAVYDVRYKLHDIRTRHQGEDGVVYLKGIIRSSKAGAGRLLHGPDGPVRVWLNGQPVDCRPEATNPATPGKYSVPVKWKKGPNEVIFALHTNGGKAWGVVVSTE